MLHWLVGTRRRARPRKTAQHIVDHIWQLPPKVAMRHEVPAACAVVTVVVPHANS